MWRKTFMLGALVWCLSGLASASSITTYTVTIDSSSVAGTAGSFDFNFNPGPLATQAASLQIVGFSSDGQLGGNPQLTGNVTAGLPGTVTFNNGTGLNEYFQGITFGSTLSFTVVLSGPAVSSPSGTSTSGSTFAFSLFSDAAGTQQILSTDATNGFAFTINLNLDGSTTVTSNLTGASVIRGIPPSLSVNGTAPTFPAGATSGNTSTITLTPVGGFTGSVALTATLTSSPAGAKDLPTLSFGSTSPANITGTAPATAILTISSTPRSQSALTTPGRQQMRWYALGGMTLAGMMFLGFRFRRIQPVAFVLLLLLVAVGITACGGNSSPPNPINPGSTGTTAGSYTVTVSATSGAVVVQNTVVVTIQ